MELLPVRDSPRTFEEIEEALDDFQVLTIDENVVGCVALHRYATPECAEIACLYVKQSHEKGGYGQILVEAAERDAAQKGVPWVFALTTRAFYFFTEKLGYQVQKLHRVAIGSITLNTLGKNMLAAGKYRHLQATEINYLINSFNTNS